MNNLKVVFLSHGAWRINQIAGQAEKLGALAGCWLGTKRPAGVPSSKYRRIWPYYFAQKPFWHLPWPDLEEKMRWRNILLYDHWVNCQSFEGFNVLHCPNTAALSAFRRAIDTKTKVLKVLDATNTHPDFVELVWKHERDQFHPNYQLPVTDWIFNRIRREAQMADAILCTSSHVKETMVSAGIQAKRCFVLPPVADNRVFKMREVIPEVPTFISVGSICLRKGHQYLFRAFSEVKAQMPQAKLICVGDIRPDFQLEWPRWQRLIEHHQNLSHAELAPLLAGSTAFVLPSLEEGFAKSIVEAMASCVPVIATRETGVESLARENESYVRVEARDVSQLANVMIKLATQPDLNQRIAQAGYHLARSAGNWFDYTQRLLMEYAKRLP